MVSTIPRRKTAKVKNTNSILRNSLTARLSFVGIDITMTSVRCINVRACHAFMCRDAFATYIHAQLHNLGSRDVVIIKDECSQPRYTWYGVVIIECGNSSLQLSYI